MSAVTIKKIRYSHDAMIDLIIASPGISQNEIAAEFGYTPAWISTVMSSDAFKERLAFRRGEIVDPTLTLTLEERFRGITERAAQVLQDKLSAPSHLIPDNLALKALELGAKGVGAGGFGATSVHIHTPPPNHLESLAQRLLAFQRTVRGEITNAEHDEVVEALPLAGGEGMLPAGEPRVEPSEVE